MRPGYKTTEFWLSVIAQALGFAVLLGFVTFNDSKTLEESLGKAVAAIFTVVASMRSVVEYIKSRTEVKTTDPAPEGDDDPGESSAGGGSILPFRAASLHPFWIALLGSLAFWAMASPAQAQLLPWRQQMNERIRFQEKLISDLASRPAPAPIIQLLPIQGSPKQELPIQGEPKQLLPIPGEPKQQPPIQGPPLQPLPPGGLPKQELPLAPPQNIGEPQQLSVQRALMQVWTPALSEPCPCGPDCKCPQCPCPKQKEQN